MSRRLPERDDPRLGFGREAPVRWRIMLFAGVFFTFAPVWTLSITHLDPRPSNIGLLLLVVISGLTGVGYAMSATVSRRLLWIVVPIHVGAIFVLNIWRPDLVGIERPSGAVVGLGFVLSIAIGYALFVWYISGEGSRSLRLRTELALAQQIHDTLAPIVDHTGAHVEAYGASVPGSEMGGDLVDLVVADGQTDVFLADVTGHGVKAGVVMAMVKSAIHALLASEPGVDRLMADLNRVLGDLTPEQMFATFACVRFRDPGAAEIGLAGHLPVLIVRGSDAAMEAVDNDALPLGVGQQDPFGTRTIAVSPGDILAMYTDGLIETKGPTGVQFGIAGVRAALAEGAAAGEDLRSLHGRVMRAVEAHGAQDDDRTLVLMRVI